MGSTSDRASRQPAKVPRIARTCRFLSERSGVRSGPPRTAAVANAAARTTRKIVTAVGSSKNSEGVTSDSSAPNRLGSVFTE
jgi:hypothetical protein